MRTPSALQEAIHDARMEMTAKLREYGRRFGPDPALWPYRVRRRCKRMRKDLRRLERELAAVIPMEIAA